MQIVVPLAGPDFEAEDGSVKAEYLLDGQPLLRRAVESRPWWRAGEADDRDLVFVLRDTDRSRRFAAESLATWYPRARSVFLGDMTGGAAMSALAGVGLVAHLDGPLCIDLADILYDGPADMTACLNRSGVGAMIPVFPSSDPLYSYLREENGVVVEAAEKRVISTMASAGTYFFADAARYLSALAHSLQNRHQVVHKGLFFVCPVVNGIVAAGETVLAIPVQNVIDIKRCNAKKMNNETKGGGYCK